MSAPQVPRPRRRLTQSEFDAELDRARPPVLPPDLSIFDKPLRTPTGRPRRWWQRGWRRG